MKICVIGSEGFIGQYLVRDLSAAGHEIVGFDLYPADVRLSDYAFIQGDLMDAAGLKAAAQGCEMVINLAAKHHDFGIARDEFFQINEQGTRVILDVLSDLRISRFVFYSSVAVYGLHDAATSEATPRTPCNDYGESKAAGEKLIEQWSAQDSSREILIVRPVVVYGPRNYANMFRLIDQMFHRRFVMVGPGQNIKSTAYVENLTAATVFMMNRMHPGIEMMNYSDEPQRKSLEIADIIQKELGRPPLGFRVPLWLAMTLASPFDLCAKIFGKNLPITANRIKKFALMNTWHGSDKVRALGFEQGVSTEEGLHRMVQWYLKEGRKNRRRCASGPGKR